MSEPTSPIGQAGIRLSGGVLAGGEGRRFGGLDKGWIAYRGRPFIEHVLAQLAPQVDDVAISANRSLGRYATLGYPVVSDRLGAGPLAGLLRLLESAAQDWLLSVPCDALDLPADLARHLVEVQRAENADVVVLCDDDGLHPIVALTRRALAPDIETFLREGGSSVQRWQARHRVARAQRAGVLINVNDAARLSELEMDLQEPAHG
ncbi:molybdenum cofactor guanylyltransferase MobA [Hydrocarboniphaga sp.]|uniref:molybdenum cofactor guanylyltransferase MobA n=1 Tax=Hydrocarboniphaga sp. TaxID=2033016 RepID=UPI003D12E3A9